MGQTFSAISDPKLRLETKKAYDTSLGLMIINLLFVCLPTLSFYWIPYFGPWAVEAVSLLQLVFSVAIYKLSARTIPTLGSGLWASHVIISILMWCLITIACIMQTVNWHDEQKYCYYYSSYNSDDYSYYDDYYGNGTYVDGSYDGYTYYSGYSPSEYCYTYSTYRYYVPSLIMMGIVTPILSVLHLIIFSINCSYIWNEMIVRMASVHQSLPLRTVNLGNGGVSNYYPYPGNAGVPYYYPYSGNTGAPNYYPYSGNTGAPSHYPYSGNAGAPNHYPYSEPLPYYGTFSNAPSNGAQAPMMNPNAPSNGMQAPMNPQGQYDAGQKSF